MDLRLEAYQIILKVLKNNDYSDSLLQQAGKKCKDSETNCDMLYNLVKGVIKMQGNLDYICSNYTNPEKFQKTDLKIKTLLYMGIYQLRYMGGTPDHAAVFETVEIAKKQCGEKAADFINAVLREYLRKPDFEYPPTPSARYAAEYSYPEALMQEWLELWGPETTEYLCLYFNEPAKLHIRVNRIATTKNKLMDYLRKRDIGFIESPASTQILQIEHAAHVLQDVAFSEGYFSVQDTSAALVVELLDPRGDESVLDLFAAPGGKATYIAERMNNTGEVIAVDKIPNKVKLIKQAMERLQIDNMKLVVEDAFRYGPVAPAFDRVLVDVPCSGWGVLGRKADLRWQYHQNMAELLSLQAKAINVGASFVKPGGCMVYSTCTMNPRENVQQIERFLKGNPNFLLVNAAEFVPTTYVKYGMLQTMPHLHDMDGAFAARLMKKNKN